MRRTRLPFVVTFKFNDKIETDTRWDFSIKKLENEYLKSIKESKKQNSDEKWELISVKPYPNSYNIYVDMGDTELYDVINAHSEKEVKEIAEKKYPNRKITIKKGIALIT